MLSSVYLSGRLSERLDENTRIVEIDGFIPDVNNDYAVTRVPVRTSRSSRCQFMSAKAGTLVILKGRLESDPKLGLLVHVEIDEHIGVDAKAKVGK